MNNLNLKEIENKLEILMKIEKKNWADFYLLIKRVETEELWRGAYNSFTQWVKDFAVRTKTHESTIWYKKKAGEVYEKYAEIRKKKGLEVEEIQNSKVSINSLVILDKIDKYSPDKTEELVEKIFNKEITRNNLQDIYKAVRPNTEVKEKINSIYAHKTDDEIRAEKIEESIKSSNILSALYGIEWLGKKKERKFFKSSYEQEKVQCFSEFPLFTGTTRHNRRIDFLCVENMTTENLWEINIHGIEIKVNEYDLLNDEKYTEYTEFVDFFYLAVSEELEEIAINNIFKGCGLIVVYKDKENSNRFIPKIIKKPNKLTPFRREDTLTSITLKLL
ncbi:MmcB family DNA repair protein [Fusobacterium sp.]|uniref:MmcB family DNA repair protein n=1 Tax=Fusobacterium sp. TaxID=68766 RepID=UPI00261F047F|nr:MmcB family DNA repair protein [Fusobacterium sp.]